MGLAEFWRERLWKKEHFSDFVLLRLNALFIGMWVMSLVPALQRVSPWWYFALVVLTFLKPLSVIATKDK